MNPLADVIHQSWDTYRTHARHLLTIAFVIYVVAAVVQLLLGTLGDIGAALAAIVTLIAAFLLQAALVKAVEDLGDGRADLSLGQTLRAAQPFIGKVAIASILAGIAIAIGFVLLIAPGLFLLTIWCLIVPVIVLENASVGQAFERSRALVKGYGWQVLGTLVLVYLILIAVNAVLALLLSPLSDVAGTLLASVVAGTIVSPFIAVVVTIAYFRLRAVPRGWGAMPGAPTM